MDGLAKERLGKRRLRGGRREAGAGRRALLGKVIGRGCDMGYFDGLTSGSFKTTPDGRRLFYPWGYLGRGYVLPSDDTADRLRRQLKTYYIVMLVAIVGASGFRAFTSAVVAGVCIVFYAIWASRQVAGLQPAGEAMSFRESSAAQARTFGARTLWLLEISSLLFVAAGIFMYLTDPAKWPMALVTTIFFGCCAASIGYMILVRWRALSPP
jgi:hypothetical protein